MFFYVVINNENISRYKKNLIKTYFGKKMDNANHKICDSDREWMIKFNDSRRYADCNRKKGADLKRDKGEWRK